MAVKQMTRLRSSQYLLASVLSEPHRSAGLALRDWERLIWQARSAELIGQLRFVLNQEGLLCNLPSEALRHLEIAWAIAQKHAQAVQGELQNLQETLGGLDVPVILLKGAAYCAQANRAATGRLFNDIDILVHKNVLQTVEDSLIRAGWLPSHTNSYDERYYREWMHEIPPMEHKNRATVLDVHHTILAPTSGIRPNPEALFEASIPIAGDKSLFRVLAPEDMVMHSACHLFFGEFHKGLRDLFDLHLLISDFSKEPDFLVKLMNRSQSLGLALPVLDALQQSQRLFGTKLPDDYLQEFASRNGKRWNQWARNWLFDQVLRPNHSSAWSSTTKFAQWLAFARSHWLRMPVPMLVYHLSHKLFVTD